MLSFLVRYRTSLRSFGEASQPCSPTRQLNWIKKHRKHTELDPEDVAKYTNYLTSNQMAVILKGIPRDQVSRIRAKLDNKWLVNIMLKRKVAQIGDDLYENYL